MKHFIALISAFVLSAWFSEYPVDAQSLPSDLARIDSGSTKAVNALWGENPLAVQFRTTTNVVVADIKGPAEITMIHFAYPEHHTPGTHSINRDVRLRIFWDGEKTPSVDCPLVDFFCDPNGEHGLVNTALVNERQGFNAYFPMPFRKSARVELLYDGPLAAGKELEETMPCYSYVCYRTLKRVPTDTGYFCASWRQEELLLGLKEYVALETTGKGKFVGWNVTVRNPYLDKYPADENEKFFIDGETNASGGIPGAGRFFGFSWGFPPTENQFPFNRLFSFPRQWRGRLPLFHPGRHQFQQIPESGHWFRGYGSGLEMELFPPDRHAAIFLDGLLVSSWAAPGLAGNLPVAQRAPAARRLFWPAGLGYSSPADFEAAGGKLLVGCGLSSAETAYHAPGYSVTFNPTNVQQWVIWNGDVFYCRMNKHQFEVNLSLPKGVTGTLHLYITDPDNFQGGRKETIVVGGETVGTFENFQKGRWIDVPVGPEKTADGKLSIKVINARAGSNAVLSDILWIEK